MYKQITSKAAIRDRFREIRKSFVISLTWEEHYRLLAKILHNLTPLLSTSMGEGVTVASYCPIQHEVQPDLIMEYIRSKGGRLCLPSVLGQSLLLSFSLWNPGDPLRKGFFNTLEPLLSPPLLDAPTHILVPLLSFDDHGSRIGYGSGCYDRTLKSLRKQGKIIAVGLAFEVQHTKALPVVNDDEPLDVVVTEHRVHVFNSHV